ncbi:hypothetical protein DUI87_09958 [Hirundo rustica rustica]|uniref:Uncharacterized protein n=1 Tax=Hirundo rustica rustica TaxID=333673 RepID=A0A3M0KH16_HIRRU|nr:hypothetical protein DUI87_09958 [Hirundo rustica rustica]
MSENHQGKKYPALSLNWPMDRWRREAGPGDPALPHTPLESYGKPPKIIVKALISKVYLQIANYQLKETEIETSTILLVVGQQISGSSGNTKSYDSNLVLSALDHSCLVYNTVFSERAGLIWTVSEWGGQTDGGERTCGVHELICIRKVSPEAIGFLSAVGVFIILMLLLFLYINKKMCIENVSGFPDLDSGYTTRKNSQDKLC